VLQLFMAADTDDLRVFEVSCTCPGYQLRARCRHIVYVAAQVERDQGYTPPLMPRALRTLTVAVKSDAEQFRAWLYEHSLILIIDQDGQAIIAPKEDSHV
jgi:uncharacterized Zn finger protein